MAFNLYFAGSPNAESDKYIKKIGANRLFSFADKSDKCFNDYRANAPKCKLFMDSGAFSVHHSGAVINIDEYIDFVNNTDGVEVWAQLDEIPFPVLNSETAKKSADVSWERYLYAMSKLKEERKDHFIPIYHFGEPYSSLERILNTEVDGKLPPYIGIGGRHGVSTSEHDVYYENLFKIIKASKNPNVKIHAFGMTVLSLLEQYPFYSADSTTWLMLAANGNIMTKCCGTLLISSKQKSRPDHLFNLNQEIIDKVELEIKQCGFTLDEVAQDYKKRFVVNIKYFKDWADNYQYKPRTHISRNRLF